MNIQEAKENALRRDALKPGDSVAVEVCKRVNWGQYFTYYEHTEVARITPKRTKFVMANGREVERDAVCCIIPRSAEHEKANKEYALRNKLNNNLYELSKAGKIYGGFDVPIENLLVATKASAELLTALKHD